MTLFSNIGFMGYPLLDVMYGSNAIIHAVIFNLLYNVLIYTYGIHKMQIGGCQKNINWKQLVNIGVGSCIIAIVLYITNLPVPLILEDTATFTGAITGPLSMLVIGDSLAQTRLRDLFTDVRLLIFSIIKLVLLPALLLWGYAFIKDPIFRGVLSGNDGNTGRQHDSNVLAQQYNGDYRLTSRGVALTTLLSVITMPFLFWVLKL